MDLDSEIPCSPRKIRKLNSEEGVSNSNDKKISTGSQVRN